jgi:hypothetical protein
VIYAQGIAVIGLSPAIRWSSRVIRDQTRNMTAECMSLVLASRLCMRRMRSWCIWDLLFHIRFSSRIVSCPCQLTSSSSKWLGSILLATQLVPGAFGTHRVTRRRAMSMTSPRVRANVAYEVWLKTNLVPLLTSSLLKGVAHEEIGSCCA